jgi:hypothetical protein
MSDKKYRLVTRSDFDGLACAVLLNDLEMIDEIKFVHPKDMQDGKIEISERDITTNLPFVPGVYLAFDHHLSETFRNHRRASQPHHLSRCAVCGARRVRALRRQEPFPRLLRRHDGRRRQGRLGAVLAR